MKCDEFRNPDQLRAVFEAEDLKPWQDGLSIVNNLRGQVDITISYLADNHRTNGDNALVLLLQVLGRSYRPDDERHKLLLTLADQLAWLKRRPAKPESTTWEANPTAAPMLSVVEAEKMLACARAVARIDVPCLRSGQIVGSSTGTGWLLTPALALTCWHVVKARNPLDPPIELTDLQVQVNGTCLTFDYTVAGEGLQYRVAALEHPTPGTQTLDYAVLRLIDRADAPLRDRGYLRLDIDAPLTTQTSLYIIQHPLGQPQQGAGDTFVRLAPSPGCILYKTPTEPGTSGSPVFNRVNWRAVALHNGENEEASLREGTLLRAILADIEQSRLDLHREIMTAQKE